MEGGRKGGKVENKISWGKFNSKLMTNDSAFDTFDDF